MTTNTSATGGPLSSVADPQPWDYDLEDVLTRLLVGLTGLDPDTGVRPAYQVDPPSEPEPGTDWVAFNVNSAEPLATRADIQHNLPNYAAPGTAANPPGYSVLLQHEVLEVLVSCYGPHSMRTISMVRDGLMVAQNREPLYKAGIGLRSVANVVAMHEISGDTNQTTQRRWDCMVTLQRAVPRTYAIENLVEAVGTVHRTERDGANRAENFDVKTPPGEL